MAKARITFVATDIVARSEYMAQAITAVENAARLDPRIVEYGVEDAGHELLVTVSADSELSDVVHTISDRLEAAISAERTHDEVLAA